MMTTLVSANDLEALYTPSKSAVYGGVAYSSFNQKIKDIHFSGATNVDIDSRLPMFQLGYKYNAYLSFEARYWLGISDINQQGGTAPGSYDGDINTWGIYLKPTMPVNEKINLYVLLGYGSSSIEYSSNNWDTENFSWGVGFDVELIKNLSFFFDYVSVASADDFDYTYLSGGQLNGIDADIDVYTLNLGLNYKFEF
jgi:opacity protein-like surface antigen